MSNRLHSVILMLESLLFGMFVLAILIDQFSAIFTDETIVEQHIHGKKHAPPGARSSSTSSSRRGSGVKRSKMEALRDVCGTGHFLMWILPCHTRDEIVIEKRLNDVVWGFEMRKNITISEMRNLFQQNFLPVFFKYNCFS